QDRDAGQEVQVLVAVGVPQPAARAAHELDRIAHVGGRGVGLLERLKLGKAHPVGPILVPCPALVNSSSSSECGTRPSTIWANDTPAWMASTQAFSLGRIPPSTPGSARETSSALL